MNSSNQLKIVGEDGILAKKILTEKEFSFKGLEWHYQNRFHLSLASGQASSKLKIKNHLCEMTGNVIKKTTQIYHQNKQYIIEDHYTLHLPPNVDQIARENRDAASTHDSDNKNEGKEQGQDKKIYIFKKSKKLKSKDKTSEKIRNTKNLTKNFCKAFLSFLKSNKIERIPRSRIKEAIAAYERIFQNKKYNNKLIKKMIADEVLRDLFRIFLEKEAANWISQSKVSNKQIHEEAISIYLNLFQSMNLVDRGFDSDSESEEERGDSQLQGQ